jgi:ABC-type dipeptide/oligopeptide/nickel transport system permease component
MRTLLGRLAWMVARLMLISALCFAMLSYALLPVDTIHRSSAALPPASIGALERERPSDDDARAGSTKTAIADFTRHGVVAPTMPLFFNRYPVDLKRRVAVAITELQRGSSPSQQRELIYLGAAALPELMRGFPKLSTDAQNRIAEAEMFVLQRMGVVASGKVETDELAISQLVSTWRELQADYSPSVRRRRVERARDRGQASHMAAAAQLDTYALSELVRTLAVPSEATNLPGLRRLTLLLSHITNQNQVIQEASTLAEAGAIVEYWKGWWALHHCDYEVLDGPTRLASTLTETQFGQWLTLSLFHGFGADVRGNRVADTFQRPAVVTLSLTLLGWFGHFFGAITTPLLLSRTSRRAFILRRILVTAGSVPVLVIVPWLAEPSLSHPHWLTAGLLCLLVGAGQAAFGECRRHTMIVSAFADPWQAASVPPEGVRTGTSWLFLTSSDWPWLLTTLFVIEYASGVSGLGRWLVTAFANRDMNTAMAASSITAFVLLFLEVLVATLSDTARDRAARHAPRPVP